MGLSRRPFGWSLASEAETYPFRLPPLPYPYEALEPHIDARTMQIHHQGHHQTYVQNLNKALEELPQFQSWELERLLSHLSDVPSSHRTTIQNNGGGHWNHSFFWRILSPTPSEPSKALQARLEKVFGSWAAFRAKFLDTAAQLFGSGWVWLVQTPRGDLSIVPTANQDNPLMPHITPQGKPILGIDVWEHAYYLKYQNRRTEYLAAVWQVINWAQVEALLG
ncbi:MAG: superoxide dismutase [Bacteroidia bacterium]|nr:superoxide dismutase [Bacteroidia bacterium]MDW8088799.1 superoxide dismutase [Bacteroidia bacterium]